MIIYVQPIKLIFNKRHGVGNYTNEQQGVSVIVYANNDAKYLHKNLPVLLNQDYADYEVIVVNDGSWDNTEDILADFNTKYDNLYHTFLNEEAKNLSRKKLSLTLGIKAAKNDIIIFTHANCCPNSNRWIKNIARNFTDRTDIVIGYTQMSDSKSLINRLIDYDILNRALRIFGYSLSISPYTGDGTNLAYRKSVFFKNKGFAKYMNLHLGDDDLFINQVANNRNTKFELSKDATVTSMFEDKFNDWSNISVNRAFTSGFYGTFSKILFGFENLNRYLFIVSFILCFIYLPKELTSYIIIGSLIIFKLVFQTLFWTAVCRNFNSKKIMFEVHIYELITPITSTIFRIISIMRRQKFYTWKLK